MTVETVLYDRGVAHAGLSALISTRLYPGVLPQKCTYPAVNYSRIFASRVPAMGADTGLVRARFQFDIWADTYAAARAVAEQVRAAYQRWRNTAGTVIQDIYFVGEVDLYEDETRIHHAALDFEIIYQE